MPYRYETDLPAGSGQDPWSSWSAFADHVTGSSDAHLCQVIQALKPRSASSSRFAWPTLVIGSECLRVRNPETDRAIELLPDALSDELSATVSRVKEALSEGTTGDEDPWFNGVMGFVEQLVDDRLGLRPFQASARTIHSSMPVIEDPWGIQGASGAAGLSSAVEDQARDLASTKSEQFREWELLLIVAAATLTRHYFKEKLTTTRSVSRWDLETLTMTEVYQPFSRRSVAALSALLIELDRLAPRAQQETTQIRAVAQALKDALKPEQRSETISLAHLQALTEFAWDRIIRRFSLYSWYPDWPEFLVRLSMDHRSHPMGRGFTRPAPRTVVDAAAIVRQALSGTTEKSAAEYPANPDGPLRNDTVEAARLSTYAIYADLLFAMVDRRREASSPRPAPGCRQDYQKDPKGKKSAEVPPPASAFVTTFDVELELALAARYPDRAFVVALPVNLVENTEGVNLASTMWLGCVIRPDPHRSVLDRVTRPETEAWFLFESPPPTERRAAIDESAVGLVAVALGSHAERLGDLPIVIRLAGSPLMELPTIQDDDGISTLGRAAMASAQLDGKLDTNDGATSWDEPQRHGVRVETRLVHATLLDEHHAIRLSLPEVRENVGALPLPAELTGSQGKYWRHWLLLGVEMSDPVIRYRVAAQVIGVGLRGDSGNHQRAARTGIVFNRRSLNSRALDMLAWCGFDVVVDPTAPLPMTAEIQHYTDHLHIGRDKQWPQEANQACPLTTQQKTEVDR